MSKPSRYEHIYKGKFTPAETTKPQIKTTMKTAEERMQSDGIVITPALRYHIDQIKLDAIKSALRLAAKVSEQQEQLFQTTRNKAIHDCRFAILSLTTNPDLLNLVATGKATND